MCSKAFYVHSCGHRSWGPLQRCGNRYVCPPENTLYYPIRVNNPCRFCRPRRRNAAVSAPATSAAAEALTSSPGRFDVSGVDDSVYGDGVVFSSRGITFSDSVERVSGRLFFRGDYLYAG
ncbi:hypothetical protein HCBG_00951 [Histoplasma capsulatum G186AR]|uniref:Uncharacterized protein n=1 Tax=Ajellomyces capsulatus (strain G186AR / H82 / ATCC MYA-2454 / RMSCC 2432) TaxID=447093 RepID=C0NCV5_AJECG|nr:uncharacterized protein HCBG_00951 [Histoplasma capsulatum G186AR]EEH11496.1 hypothetical protein HCBG_00951 [Histoplasma capsulatum G186AR]